MRSGAVVGTPAPKVRLSSRRSSATLPARRRRHPSFTIKLRPLTPSVITDGNKTLRAIGEEYICTLCRLLTIPARLRRDSEGVK